MSTDFVLPSLSQLTENFISAIYKANSDASNILDSFLFKDALITVNGKNISRADFLNELRTEKFLEVGAEVDFLNIVEVVSLDEAGSVGTFFKVSIQQAILVQDGPVIHEVTASLNVDIEEDPSIPVPQPPFVGDRRRAKALNLVILDTTSPIAVLPPVK